MGTKAWVFILAWVSLRSFGSPVDSSLFYNSFERNAFEKLVNGDSVREFDFFLAVDFFEPQLRIQGKIDKYARSLQARISKMNDRKKLRTVFNAVHNDWLKIYQEEAYFGQIFEDGTFNCVTSTALYAFILDQLQIPYQIVKLPNHVYLVADPGDHGMLYESTNPMQGAISFDDGFKSDFVSFLLRNKRISEEEARSLSMQELFSVYFINHQPVSLLQLAGIQYYNKGVVQYNQGFYTKSFKSFEKASLLFDDGVISYMKSNALIQMLNRQHVHRKYDGATLAYFLNTNDSSAEAWQYGQEYFRHVTHELLTNHPDVSAYCEYFSRFSEVLELKDTLEFYQTYFSMLGYYYSTQQQFYSALGMYRRAHALNSENIQIREWIRQSVAGHLVRPETGTADPDSLEKYAGLFSFLNHDRWFQQYRLYSYASIIADHFNTGNPVLGDLYLSKMEKYLGFARTPPASDRLVAKAYMQAGAYYIRQSRYGQAERLLRNGLQRVPGSNDLKHLLKSAIDIQGASYVYPEMLPENTGQRKYMAARIYAQASADTINNRANKYLCGKWSLLGFTKLGIAHHTGHEKPFILWLGEDNAFQLEEPGSVQSGKWEYAEEECTVILTPNEDPLQIRLLITDIGPDRISALMLLDEDYDGATEVEFEAIR